jgi:hypothetical protein
VPGAEIAEGGGVTQTKARECGDGRVAFLAILEEVRTAIHAGRTRASIYRSNRERLSGISKRQFERYVRRYVTSEEGGPGSGELSPAITRDREAGTGGRAATQVPTAKVPTAGRGGDGPIWPRIEQPRSFAFKAEDAKKEKLV